MKNIFVRFKTDYRLITGYIIAFILLLISYLVTLYSNKELIKQTELVSHTHKVISDLENLLSAVKDGETGLRGFLNSKDSVFLDPFYRSLLVTNSMFTTVKDETSDDEIQQQQLIKLKMLIEKKYDNIKSTISRFLSHNYTIDEVLVENTYTGKASMDSIRKLVSDMQEHENKLLEVRSNKVDSRYTALNTIVITSLVLAFIFAGFGAITFVKENEARQQADKKVTAYQQELKRRIEELDKANKELIEMRREEKFASTGRIARNIAHEVRNPLTNIDLAVSQIKEEMNKDNEDADFLFDMVTRNSSRINQLITELLNATRFTDLNFNNASINQLLDEALELAKDRIELNNIKVEKNYSPDICDVSVDPEKIKTAFLNIIINAIEAMKENGEKILTLHTKGENNECIVEIADNGIGMDDAALSKLFEAYYTTKPKGNGLGLTNTHNIILNHKGNIDVESSPGNGTKFILSFNFAT
ncbi:CHASE3 domain-containing protein [Ferruginibacter lapsinanis]|uniref:CHASE3 domain-containing protein n=1 Tax=Ferruginibacter lapsinanis TaxID=563172 RepID=UPI001E63DCBE|nr:CHASE3 domain-containing protein [Ferruginibacter lapsinanis]UEG51044.1 CHASE3 domain-containing protein [Ferruginibacter lapsinanis]